MPLGCDNCGGEIFGKTATAEEAEECSPTARAGDEIFFDCDVYRCDSCDLGWQVSVSEDGVWLSDPPAEPPRSLWRALGGWHEIKQTLRLGTWKFEAYRLVPWTPFMHTMKAMRKSYLRPTIEFDYYAPMVSGSDENERLIIYLNVWVFGFALLVN